MKEIQSYSIEKVAHLWKIGGKLLQKPETDLAAREQEVHGTVVRAIGVALKPEAAAHQTTTSEFMSFTSLDNFKKQLKKSYGKAMRVSHAQSAVNLLRPLSPRTVLCRAECGALNRV